MESEVVAAVHSAIAASNIELIGSFLEKHPNDARAICETEVPREGTALHKVAKTGNCDVLRMILKTGANVNTNLSGGFVVTGISPLSCAVSAGHIDMVKCLIASGADVNSQDSEGQTCLHTSCQNQSGLDMTRILLECDADVNIKDNKGQTALHCGIIRSVSKQTILLLIDHNADVDIRDNEGQTALHYAAEWGNTELVQALHDHGAHINVVDQTGKTPLHLAENDEMRDLLTSLGADSTIRTERGQLAVRGQIDMQADSIKHIDTVLKAHRTRSEIQPLPPGGQNKRSPFKLPERNPDVQGNMGNVMQELLSRKK